MRALYVTFTRNYNDPMGERTEYKIRKRRPSIPRFTYTGAKHVCTVSTREMIVADYREKAFYDGSCLYLTWQLLIDVILRLALT